MAKEKQPIAGKAPEKLTDDELDQVQGAGFMDAINNTMGTLSDAAKKAQDTTNSIIKNMKG